MSCCSNTASSKGIVNRSQTCVTAVCCIMQSYFCYHFLYYSFYLLSPVHVQQACQINKDFHRAWIYWRAVYLNKQTIVEMLFNYFIRLYLIMGSSMSSWFWGHIIRMFLINYQPLFRSQESHATHHYWPEYYIFLL